MHQIIGAKAGSKKSRSPLIAADSAQSRTYIKQLIGLSAGEVAGLEKGYNSIYLEDTPLHDEQGNPNFQNITVEVRNGTNDQEYIQGFPEISSEIGIQTELKSSIPWVRAISNIQLDAVTVRFRWGALREQNPQNGDVNGITIKYAIDVQTDGGAWVEAIKAEISDKTSANYERSHRVELPKASKGWQVRARRITPNSTSEYVSDKMYVQAITETIDAKLAYPNVALLFLQYDAETFGGSVAKVAVRMKGALIQVPSNYNPVTRQYVGMWDGLFKEAYSNNPAYAFYHVCLDKTNGLGNRISSAMIDKWSVYSLGQYCDQLVSDGKGGEEPRYTLNVYIQAEEDAWTTLQKITSIFNGFVFWDGTKIQLSADVPQDSVYTYTGANVIDGMFEYTGVANKDRHTVFIANWDNPENRFKTEQVVVRDEKQISQHGIKKLELNLWGCTSEGQAQRAARRAMLSEKYETRTVTFKVGFDALVRGKTKMPQVGKVIEVADSMFAGRANGGRIAAVSADRKTITIDRDNVVCRAGDRLVVNGEDGQAQARIVQAISGRVITVVAAFDSVAAENVWVVDAKDLATMKFRVISITQSDLHQFTVTALQYSAAKYDAIDNSAFIDERPITIVNPSTQASVKAVFIEAESMVQQGLSVAIMTIYWEQVEAAVKYQVEWRKDDGSWVKMPLIGNNSIDITGIYSGMYEARVVAISAFDIVSLPTYSQLTEVKGKQGLPPKLAFIRATGILFGMQLDWGFPNSGASDTAYTEIEVSPDGKSNIALLGQFAYPTNTQTIQGLQANLTQFYRGRLVDRIGNKGEWSLWSSGKTSAAVDEILDLLDGQITESQLDKNLREKVDKIDSLNDYPDFKDSVNSSIDRINKEIQDTQNSISEETKNRQDEIKAAKDGLSTEIKDSETSILEVVETNKKTSDLGIAAAQSDIKTVADEQKLLAKKTDGVYAFVIPITSDSTELTADSSSAQASSWTLYSAQIDGDLALGQRIDTVHVEVDENKASIQEERTARIEGDKASTLALNTYISSNDDALSLVRQQAKTAVDKSTANAETLDEVIVTLGDKAAAGALEEVKAEVKEVDGKVTAATKKLDGVYARVVPLTSDSTELTADSTSKEASAWDLYSAQIDGDNANAEAIKQVAANSAETNAIFREEIKAQASTTNALTQRTETLQTTVNGNTASIQRQDESIDGLELRSTLKLDSNGYVGGVTVGNDGRTVDMIIRADKFAIAAPEKDGNASKFAFVYQAAATTLPNGTVIPPGLYLDDAVVGRISANRIDADNLSAISANLGTFKTTDKEGNSTIISGPRIVIQAANGVKVVEIGIGIG